MELNIVHTFRLLLTDLNFPWEERNYLIKRLTSEGFTFLSKTLPSLWQWVLKSIENKHYDPAMPMLAGGCPFSFKGSTLRRWRLEFSALNSGEDISPPFLYQLATVCGYFYKLSLPFNGSAKFRAAEKYQQVQSELAESWKSVCKDTFVDRVRSTVLNDYGLLNLRVDDAVNLSREGPGSVIHASGNPRLFKDSRNARVPAQHWPIKHVFRFRKQSVYSGRRINFYKTPDDVPECEVIFVPKDQRGPRVISKETHCRAKLSLGFHDYIKPHLEKVTNGRIQFTDQSIFVELARLSSIDRKFATLDMEAGSDRISIFLANRIYGDVPVIRYFLRNARASRYVIKNVVTDDGLDNLTGELNCIAGMGSGLTFPLMSLTIHAVIRTAMKDVHCSAKQLANVFVYGDDVIVPNECYDVAVAALQRVGMIVNIRKSFTAGYFRESCGGDFYRGVQITPIRLKQTFCDNVVTTALRLKPDPKSRAKGNVDKFVFKLERHARLLVTEGLERLSSYYYALIDSYVSSNFDGVLLNESTDITNPDLCRYAPFKSITDLAVKSVKTLRFCPEKTQGNLDRLICRKLRSYDSSKGKQFVSWRLGPNRLEGRRYDDLSDIPEIASPAPMWDNERYTGYLKVNT